MFMIITDSKACVTQSTNTCKLELETHDRTLVINIMSYSTEQEA